MAHQRIGMACLVLVLMTVLWAEMPRAAAQSSSCTNVLISMSPCLNYIMGNSSTPSSSCCSRLSSVVSSQPQCLCEALNGGGSSLGINVNQTQALALPGACKVQTPPLSRCNAASPADSPSGTPSGTPDSTNEGPSGTGSKTKPSIDTGSSSGASSTKMTVSLLFVLLSITSYASTSTVC